MADNLELELSILAEESMANACRERLGAGTAHAAKVRRLAEHCEREAARLKRFLDNTNG